ncbi:uncharacterized protein LOC122849708 [Aphidius gifuensis]|uniref:uncharacterized protein LOC122849708 n=1 Tax=Aphidius gifuensis TaxID=684658 RepID=UPI001CDD1E3A|nr:uncharacterized protein LOC122849708 [Aphidius gifuensis]
MSAILRNTLRFVSTAKYLQTMPHMSYRLNDSMALNGSNYLQCHESKRLYQTQGINSWVYEKTVITSVNKILSVFTGKERKSSDVGNFIVSLSNREQSLVTPAPWFGQFIGQRTRFFLPPTFSTKHNGAKIEQKYSNRIAVEEEKTSYEFGKLNISLDGGELKFKVKDSDETFILKHAVHVEAHNNPSKTLKDGGTKPVSMHLSSICHNAKIISKTESDESDLRTTAYPNEYKWIKLQFPMTVSFEGARQEVKIDNRDDNLIVYHTVDIQAYKELYGKLNNETADRNENRKSEVGEIQIQLESGDLFIEAREPCDKSIYMKHDVHILVNLDNRVPFIAVKPHVEVR